MAIRLNNAMRSGIVDGAVVANLGSGSCVLRIYNGTQPGTGGGSTSGCTSLVVINTDVPAWDAASNGTATLTAGSYTGTASSNGTATWARLADSTGTTYVIDGGCGTAATSDFVIDTNPFSAGATITLTTCTIIMPGS